MSREQTQAAPDAMRALTVAEAIAKLDLIEASLDAVCASAPGAVAEFGGRRAVMACCQLTCVGLVPRFPVYAWEAMAIEHAERRQFEGGRPA